MHFRYFIKRALYIAKEHTKPGRFVERVFKSYKLQALLATCA